MNCGDKGWISVWQFEFHFYSYLTSKLQNSNPKWEDWLLGNLKILHQGKGSRFSQIFLYQSHSLQPH